MKIFFRDQNRKFEEHLNELKKRRLMKYDRKSLKEKVSTIFIGNGKNINDVNIDCFYEYQIFPSNIMTFLGEWQCNHRKMKVGDTILQQAYIPPFKFLSQKIIFGVRIKEIIDEKLKKGFSYETLEGHVERGESVFTIEQTESGLIFKIQTFSEPGNWLTKAFGSIFTLPYQAYCTRKALENVTKQIQGQKLIS